MFDELVTYPQYAWWETKFFPYVNVPWATMESEACPYLDNGLGCNNNTMERGSKFLVMDIPVALLYPRGEVLSKS